jgi:hypothetical protein
MDALKTVDQALKATPVFEFFLFAIRQSPAKLIKSDQPSAPASMSQQRRL